MGTLESYVNRLDSQDVYWSDRTVHDLTVRVQEDYAEQQKAENTAKAIVQSFEQYIPYSRDFRKDAGIDLGAKLDASEVMDSKLAQPVIDLQKTLRSAATYLDKGNNYKDASKLAQDLKEAASHGSKDCQRACNRACEQAFGASFDDFLESCQKSIEEAPKRAIEREKEKCGRLGFKEYGIQQLATYGSFTDAQIVGFQNGAQKALDDADIAYASKISVRDKLYSDAQAEVRERDDMGYDLDDGEDPFESYSHYAQNTNFEEELDVFYNDYYEVFESADSDFAKRQLRNVMVNQLGQEDWDDFVASKQINAPSVSKELEQAFAAQPQYDAWEQENMAQLE